MISQVVFKLDKKLKDRAMKKAQSDGIAFSAVLKMATKAYADGELEVGIGLREEFNDKTRKEIERALKDIKARKNLSPRFTNAEDALAWLNKKS